LTNEYGYRNGQLLVTTASDNSYEPQWLVTDQLGTPRMIFDKTGALANVKRHDYLPFGEEIVAGTGGRTIAQGYTGAADAVRQKFTQKERDNETRLDYFDARYYSNSQGRFTSADSFGGSQLNPQTLNRYSYVQNDPLNFTDPTGNISEPWKMNPLDYLFGPRISEPMCGQGKAKKVKLTNGTAPLEGCQGTNCPPPANLATVTVTADPDIIEFPGNPKDAPGDTIVERYVSAPVKTALELADWASKSLSNVAYAMAPDYGYAGFNIPVLGGVNFELSKDWHLYWSWGPGGNHPGTGVNWKNWKAGLQVGVAYFATTEMSTHQRDEAISGPGLNIVSGPIGGYFTKGGPPALTIGWPFTNLGANVSKTKRIF
jgi:RHS repeat-associated protein